MHSSPPCHYPYQWAAVGILVAFALATFALLVTLTCRLWCRPCGSPRGSPRAGSPVMSLILRRDSCESYSGSSADER